MKLVVMGQGYVGLPLAIRSAEVGYEVIGFDLDQSKILTLMTGSSHVEDVTPKRIAAMVAAGRYKPSCTLADIEGYDIAIITVPTPLRDGVPDMSYVESASHMLGKELRPGATIVLESTTYPGTTDELVAGIMLDESGLKAGEDYFLGFSPERIDPGNPQFDFQTTPKIVSGIGPSSLERVQRFYETVCDTVVPVSSTRVAELAKILENTFRHVNIALVNELAQFANAMDINIWEVVNAAATKPFGFMKFTPGPGVGGHCLPIDPAYMGWRVKTELGQPFRFVELADDINNHMPDYVVRRAGDLLNDASRSVRGSKILVLGMAYKPGTSDVRESPAERIIELLTARGAEVSVSDPHVLGFKTSPKHYGEYDLVLLATDHDEFDYERIADESQRILDTRNRFPKAPHIFSL